MSDVDSNCKQCDQKSNDLVNGICSNCRTANSATIAPTPTHQNDATIAQGATAAPASTSSKRVGDYDLIEEIARGGMGVVYKANHRNLNRVSAVKMILGGRFSSEEELQRFRIEAESAAKLDHPAIVPIFEIGEYEGQAFFAMKYIEGGSLAEKATSFATRPQEAVELISKVADAVNHAHQRGILHRDLKPANILLDHGDQPYVTDLGLAKSTTGGSDLTHTGAVLGTPSYMPPEQAAGKSVTTAADIYALGAILYELIVGRPPYQGDTTVQVVMQVVEGPPAPPHKINPAVDPDLELICLKAMEREPSERYSSAQAMASDLESWMAGDSISVRPPSFQAKISGWLKRNQSLAYGVFAAVFGFMICAPAVLTFFSGTLGQVYDEFPGTDRPWMFKIWVPNLISLLFAVVLFLFVWPSIGFLNAVISKPPTFLRSTISGFRISAFLSLIFYFLVGWLITIQGVHNYSSSNLNTMTNALWPSAESTAEEAVEKANNLFGGLEHIPETDRAKVVARRLEADRYASLPFSFGVLTLVVAGFAGPIIYGTMIASSLRRRNLPTWLLLLRYLIAWCATTILAIALIGLTYTFLISSSGGEMQSSMNSTMLTIGVLILLIYLVMRRWKKSPAEPSVA